MKVKLIPIGNSKGVRIPQAFIRACGLGEHVEMRIEQNAIVLVAPRSPRENWEKAFERMAAAGDDQLLIPDELSNDWDDAEWEW